MGKWNDIKKDENQLNLREAMEDCHDEMKDMLRDPLPKSNAKAGERYC